MGDAIGKAGGGFISEGVLPAISSWSVIHSPNLSACHRCGLGFPINGSVDRPKTIDSKWRVVLLCRKCFIGVRSAQVCSYCFSWFPELEKGLLDCNMCSRRVHRTCVSLHHRIFSNSLLDAGNFNCIDCCPIPLLRRGDHKSLGGSTSRTTFSFSSEDLVRGASSISEKNASFKGKARENVAKKVTVEIGSSDLERKAFDAADFLKEPSCMNLITPDEKMALRLHQTINGSRRISRSLCPKSVSQFTVPEKEQCSYNSAVRIIDSNPCTHYDKIEVSTESKSLPDDRDKSESVLTNGPLFNQVNGDLKNQDRRFSTGNPEDSSLNMTEGSLKTLACIDEGSNACHALLPCHNLNTRPMSKMASTKYRFGDCDGEGSSKLKRKSIDAIGLNGSLKKYCRSWGSGRNMQDNSHFVLSISSLFEQENGTLLKQNMVRSTGCPRDFSLQEKESSPKFPVSTDDRSNANSTLVSFTSLDSWLNSTTPVAKYRFEDCDKVEYSKFINDIGLGRLMKKYFRIYWDSGRFMQGNSHLFLTNSPFKRKVRVLMKQTRGCNKGCSGDFSLKEKESFLKFLDYTDDVRKACPALLLYRFNLWSNSSVALTKNRFGVGDGVGSTILQRKSIDTLAYRSMKKYVRKHWSSKIIMKGNSESILINSSLFKKENGDLPKHARGCNAGYSEGFLFKENVCSLQFSDSTNDGNIASALLPCHSLNTWLNSAIPPTNYSFCDGDGKRSKELKRKRIDAMVSDTMKKYYRKRWGSKIFVQGNSQLIPVNSPLFKQENEDLLKQTRGCSTNPQEDVSSEEISLRFPFSTDDGSNIDSASLQFHGLNTFLNGRMPVIKYKFGNGDGEGCFKLQRRSIDAIGSDGSLKKYFRKHLGF